MHQELSPSSSGVNQRQKLRTLSRLGAKKCKQLLERGNPPVSTGCKRVFLSAPWCGSLLYFVSTRTKYKAYTALQKSQSHQRLRVSHSNLGTNGSRAPTHTSPFYPVFFSPLACIIQLLLLSRTSFHYFCLTASTTDT